MAASQRRGSEQHPGEQHPGEQRPTGHPARQHRARRWGITLPLQQVPLDAQRDVVARLTDFGYSDAWSSEVNATDAVTPLVLASQWAPDLRLGTAIVPVYTRGPALLAMSAATLASLAPGRFVLGIGTSSQPVVEQWNGIRLEKPYQRARDTLRPGMIKLAAAEADGVITNWLSPRDVEQVRAVAGPATELIARVFVCPTADAEVARAIGRRLITSYLTVGVYAAF